MSRAKITKHIEIPMEEIMEMIRERYPEVQEERYEAPPFLEVAEDGDYDRGTYTRRLKSITFYIYAS
jgi:hypothetical protein